MRLQKTSSRLVVPAASLQASLARKALGLLQATLLGAVGFAPSVAPAQAPAKPPAPTSPMPDAREVLHVPDPFSYLRDAKDPRTQALVMKSNQAAEAYFEGSPEVAYYERAVAPFILETTRQYLATRAGGQTFYLESRPADDHPRLMVRAPGATPRMLIDPNGQKEPAVLVKSFAPSPDGKSLLLGMGTNLQDDASLRIMDVATGTFSDTIPKIDADNLNWSEDGKSIVYLSYPEMGSRQADGAVIDTSNATLYLSVKRHVLGTPVEGDAVVIGPLGAVPRGEPQPYLQVWADPTSSLVVQEESVNYAQRLSVPRPGVPGKFDLLDFGAHADTHPVGVVGNKLYVTTNGDGAPLGKLMAVDLADPEHARENIVAGDGKRTLRQAVLVNKHLLVVQWLEEGASQLEVRDLKGGQMRLIAVPPFGTVSSLSDTPGQDEILFSYTSMATPVIGMAVDLASGDVKTFPQTDYGGRKLPELEAGRVMYPLPDGKGSAPVYLVRARGTKLDGKAPLILTGYGGFNVNVAPFYPTGQIPNLEAGAVYGVVVLPGGGEKGAAFRELGDKDHKEYLYRALQSALTSTTTSGWARPGVAWVGASNAGTTGLVEAIEAPRDMFRAVVSSVPVANMLHFMDGASSYWAGSWKSEFGDPTLMRDLRVMERWDPVTRILQDTAARKAATSTAIYIQASATDPRVPNHNALVFAETLRAQREAVRTGAPATFIMSVSSGEGHGTVSSKAMAVKQSARTGAFLMKELKIQVPAGK